MEKVLWKEMYSLLAKINPKLMVATFLVYEIGSSVHYQQELNSPYFLYRLHVFNTFHF